MELLVVKEDLAYRSDLSRIMPRARPISLNVTTIQLQISSQRLLAPRFPYAVCDKCRAIIRSDGANRLQYRLQCR